MSANPFAATLVIDQSARTWQLVSAYANERIATLQDACCALGATHSEREQAAARIAELRAMLQAPKDSVAIGQAQMNKPGVTY
jgi:hypothetical protein